MRQFYVIYRDDTVVTNGRETPGPLRVSNQLFEQHSEALKWAHSIWRGRQPRVVEMVSFRCPSNGEWIINAEEEMP